MVRSFWVCVCFYVVAGVGLVCFAPGRFVLADELTSLDQRESRIPAPIAAEARRLGIALANVKLQGDSWVGCEGTDSNASCVVLGRVARTPGVEGVSPTRLTGLPLGAVLDVHQYGKAVEHVTVDQPNRFGRGIRDQAGLWSFELNAGVEARVSLRGQPDKVVDTLPQYRREGPNLVRTKDYKLVRDYIDARPDEPFNVIVTVPALCEPCRQLDKVVHESFSPRQISSGQISSGPSGQATSNRSLPIKLFILEYFSFAEAERELLGTGAVFPTTLVYGVEAQPRQKVTRFIGNLRGGSLEDVSRPLLSKFRRGVPHTITRGLIGPDLLLGNSSVPLLRR